MTLVGMDVEQVRQLAKDLHAQGDHVGEVIARVDRMVQSMGSIWRGHDAQEFVRSWVGQRASALRGVQASIEDLADSASRNANDQQDASGTSGSAVGTVGTGSGIAGWIKTGVSNITTVKNVELGGIKPWDLVTSLGTAGELAGISGLKSLGVVDVATRLTEYYDKFNSGTFSLTDDFDLTADAIQGFGLLKVNAVANLGGAAIHIWSDVAREAAKLDWSSEAASQTWDYVRGNPGVVAEELSKATLVVGSRLLGYFKIP